MLDTKEEELYRHFLDLLQQKDCSPVDEMLILTGSNVSNIFLSPSEIEGVELGEGELIPLAAYRKLNTFRYYFGNELDEVEKNMTQAEISRLLGMKQIGDIIEIFSSASYFDLKNSTRKYAIYFLAIEKWYEEEQGQALSFKGLDTPVGYEEHLGF